MQNRRNFLKFLGLGVLAMAPGNVIIKKPITQNTSNAYHTAERPVFLLFNRVLSPREIKQLQKDPLIIIKGRIG